MRGCLRGYFSWHACFFSARGKCITVAENFCLGKKRELEQPKTEIFHFRSILKAPWVLCNVCRNLVAVVFPLFSCSSWFTSVRSSSLIDEHYHEGVFRQISLISSSSIRGALYILFSVTETCGTTKLLMEQGGYANGSQTAAALNNTGSRYVPRSAASPP